MIEYGLKRHMKKHEEEENKNENQYIIESIQEDEIQEREKELTL